jgi:hypothetical protein
LNYVQILEEAFLREAWLIHNYNILAALWVNTNQTQCVYQQGTNHTYNPISEKQGTVIGKDEKCTCTAIPSISDGGELLPLQAIFTGCTLNSCPSKMAAFYDEAQWLGFLLEPSMNGTYWSTLETMKLLVSKIIVPYLECKKKELGIEAPEHQKSIWKIDCWSVHKSEESMKWMKMTHPNIIVLLVPGNCTGVFQPLDIGIQCVFMQVLRRSAHRDLVAKILTQLDADCDAELYLDTTLGVLQDRMLGWLVDAFHVINDANLCL